MLKWLTETKREELMLFYIFWKGLTPFERKIYAAYKICLLPPAQVEYHLVEGGKQIRKRDREKRICRYDSPMVEAEIARIVGAWRNMLAGLGGLPVDDYEFKKRCVYIEYGFIALLRDLVHGGDWEDMCLKVPGWRIARLALDTRGLEPLVDRWLDVHKPWSHRKG